MIALGIFWQSCVFVAMVVVMLALIVRDREQR